MLLVPNWTVRPLGQCIIGFVILLLGGSWMVDGAIVIAKRMGWSPLLIGVTIVSFGTSAPELVFNIIAGINKNTALSFGNIVGSNITNATLVLGLAAVISPLKVDSRIIQKEIPWLIVVSIAFLILGFAPQRFGLGGETEPGWSYLAGLILVAMFCALSYGWFRMAQSQRKDKLSRELVEETKEDIEEVGSLSLAIPLFLIGLGLLVVGGWVSEIGAVGIAQWFDLSQEIIGLTIVALATSLPEITTAAVASWKGHNDLAIGNVVGSNLFNITRTMGITALISPVPLPLPYGWIDLGVMVAVTIMLLPIAIMFARRVTRLEGALLLAAYVAYMTFTVLRESFGK